MENLFVMVPRKASATLALTSTTAGGAQPAVNYIPDVKVTTITLAGATAAPSYTVNLTNVEDGLLFRIKLTNLQTSGTTAATGVTIVRGGSSVVFTANTHTAALLAVPGGLQLAGELLDGAGVTSSVGSSTGMIS